MPIYPRRRFIAASSLLGCRLLAAAPPANEKSSDETNHGEASGFTVQKIQTFSRPLDRYHAWPTVAICSDGRLIVAASGGRQGHIDPLGRVDLYTSYDRGDHWGFAQTICDTPIDDRDAGIVQTPKGTLLVSTFTSLAYEDIFEKEKALADGDGNGKSRRLSPEQFADWQAAHGRLPDGQHRSYLGCWMLRSDDGGRSWQPRQQVPINSPHGPFVLLDGSLFYVGKTLWQSPLRVAAYQSGDDGRSWSEVSEIPARPGDKHDAYHELHGVQAKDGRIVVHIRNHNDPNRNETLQTHSDDGGKSWAEPYSIGVWGLPSHLTRLADGRLLMSYGHRRAPLGVQARISDDSGRSWSAPMVIYGEGTSTDLGYPSTVELDDRSLVTVWYERMPGSTLAQLRSAQWQLKS